MVTKSSEIKVDNRSYIRIPVKTHVITAEDKLTNVFATYLKPIAQPGDILFISEKAVSCSQSRAIPLDEIKPRPLARMLSKFVLKSPHGIGLGSPETMEMALRECGVLRILFASLVSVTGKLLGKRGWFYVIAGDKVRSIDGPTPNTIPPYNKCVVLAPNEPDKVAQAGASVVGNPVAVVDANDLGVNILGVSDSTLDKNLLLRILADNPLGQAREQTPCGIIRAL